MLYRYNIGKVVISIIAQLMFVFASHDIFNAEQKIKIEEIRRFISKRTVLKSNASFKYLLVMLIKKRGIISLVNSSKHFTKINR